jgi:hypothetical protein
VTKRVVDLELTVRPKEVKARAARVRVVVDAESVAGTPRGRVVLSVTDKPREVGRLDERGRVVFRLGKFRQPGLKALTVRYLGNDQYARDRETTSFRVSRK